MIISNTLCHDGRIITLFLNFVVSITGCVVPPNDCKISICCERICLFQCP